MADESWHRGSDTIRIGKEVVYMHCTECADKAVFWHRRTEDRMWEQLGKYIYWDTKNLVGVTSTFKGAELLVQKHNEKVTS
jgi:hypothetical protein